MKIAYQQVMGAPEGDEWVLSFNRVLRENIDMVKSPDTEVEIRTLKKGLNKFEAMFYSYTNFLGYREILEGIIQAEKEGFDAVMICCFYDPVLKEARQAVNIPVIGAAESAMLMATMMGRKFGVITVSPEGAFDMEDNIVNYGLSARSTPIRPIPASPREQMLAIQDAGEELEAFQTVCRELISDGAEIILPGCMVMAPAMRMAPGCDDMPNGVEEVDGVPVMDIVGTQVLMAETMVRLKKAGSSWVSRKGLYAQPSEKAMKCASGVSPYDGPGVWKS